MTQILEPLTTAERAGTTLMSVKRYRQLSEAGVLDEDDRIELLENRIVDKMSKNPPHEYSKQTLKSQFDCLLPIGWTYRTESPIALDDSEPEPDGAVVVRIPSEYRDRHPGATETAIVIEVAHATLARDRGVKRRIYARAGLSTYWIVNLIDRVIEVYTDPQPDSPKRAYASHTDFGEDDTIPVILDGVTVGTVAVRDILP